MDFPFEPLMIYFILFYFVVEESLHEPLKLSLKVPVGGDTSEHIWKE